MQEVADGASELVADHKDLEEIRREHPKTLDLLVAERILAGAHPRDAFTTELGLTTEYANVKALSAAQAKEILEDTFDVDLY